MTVVRPELQFGIAELDGDGRVRGFREKPRAEHWVNGGFFCFEPGALGYMDEDSVLEREPLERLAAGGQLHAFRHDGFWDCMDTYKDAVLLNDIWAAGGRALEGLGLMRSAFVTGAYGLLGSALVRALLDARRRGHRPAPRQHAALRARPGRAGGARERRGRAT